ncbi:MAG: hypothetical protein WAV89_16140 [Ignavibacteriaceae bacterium]
MGAIIYKTLIRLAVSILVLWFFKDYFDEKYFWIISLLAIYFFVFNPTFLAYKKFADDNRAILTDTLCSSCKHFDESAVLCMKYDKHPTENFIPCEGRDWEPK